VANADRSHHLQWFKFPDDECTWAEEGHVNNCKKLVKMFWEDLGITKSEFDGQEVRASLENIGE
jgi:Chromo (CHRromatin Organisation MOdifier) domain